MIIIIDIEKFRNSVCDTYKSELATELSLRVCHNQHSINGIQATVNNIIETRREKEMNGVPLILNKLRKIDRDHPFTKYDEELNEMSNSKLLRLNFVEILKKKRRLSEDAEAKLMDEQDNRTYRELCDPESGVEDFHDRNIN